MFHRRQALVSRCGKHPRDGESEGASFAQGTLHRDVAAQPSGELARNGEAEAGASVAAVSGAVGLAEGFEDYLLLICGDADAAVTHRERHALVRGVQNPQTHRTILGELECVREQIAQYLLDAQPVAHDRSRRLRRQRGLEGQVLLRGDRLEGAPQRFEGARQVYRFDLKFHSSCLDAREVEDVVDENQQIVA